MKKIVISWAMAVPVLHDDKQESRSSWACGQAVHLRGRRVMTQTPTTATTHRTIIKIKCITIRYSWTIHDDTECYSPMWYYNYRHIGRQVIYIYIYKSCCEKIDMENWFNPKQRIKSFECEFFLYSQFDKLRYLLVNIHRMCRAPFSIVSLHYLDRIVLVRFYSKLITRNIKSHKFVYLLYKLIIPCSKRQFIFISAINYTLCDYCIYYLYLLLSP